MSYVLENKIYVKLPREKLYKLQTKVYFSNIDFGLGKKENSMQPIFGVAKSYRTKFGIFSIGKLQEYNKLIFVKCRTFEAVSYGVSCFF